MQSLTSKNFRLVQSLQLSECISAIDISSQYLAVGCLDENLYIWNSILEPFEKSPIQTKSGHTMGIVDIKFNKDSTHLAVSCLDSTIRDWEIDGMNMQKIQCQVMENWKLAYCGNNIVCCGDMGRVNYYDNISREKLKKIDAGQVYLTCISSSIDNTFLATGNDVGDLFIIKLDTKNKIVQLKPHHKIIRSSIFTEDTTKVVTASDDDTIKIIDIGSEKVIGSLEGHKQGVSCLSGHPMDSRILYSCSFDKTIKCWDIRMKNCVGTAISGSQLWSCKSTGKHVICGGDNGLLCVYSMQ